MSVDFYVAIEQARWPTPAALNQCISELHYPVKLIDIPSGELTKPLATMPQSIGLFVRFEGGKVPLETSITQLGPNSPYALGLKKDAPVIFDKTNPDGIRIVMYDPQKTDAFEPRDLNADLKSIGAKARHYKDGDYVLTFSFRSQVQEYRAGAYVMAAMIKCFDGFGFEMQGPSFGTTEYADKLVQAAANPTIWK